MGVGGGYGSFEHGGVLDELESCGKSLESLKTTWDTAWLNTPHIHAETRKVLNSYNEVPLDEIAFCSGCSLFINASLQNPKRSRSLVCPTCFMHYSLNEAKSRFFRCHFCLVCPKPSCGFPCAVANSATGDILSLADIQQRRSQRPTSKVNDKNAKVNDKEDTNGATEEDRGKERASVSGEGLHFACAACGYDSRKDGIKGAQLQQLHEKLQARLDTELKAPDWIAQVKAEMTITRKAFELCQMERSADKSGFVSGRVPESAAYRILRGLEGERGAGEADTVAAFLAGPKAIDWSTRQSEIVRLTRDRPVANSVSHSLSGFREGGHAKAGDPWTYNRLSMARALAPDEKHCFTVDVLIDTLSKPSRRTNGESLGESVGEAWDYRGVALIPRKEVWCGKCDKVIFKQPLALAGDEEANVAAGLLPRITGVRLFEETFEGETPVCHVRCGADADKILYWCILRVQNLRNKEMVLRLLSDQTQSDVMSETAAALCRTFGALDVATRSTLIETFEPSDPVLLIAKLSRHTPATTTTSPTPSNTNGVGTSADGAPPDVSLSMLLCSKMSNARIKAYLEKHAITRDSMEFKAQIKTAAAFRVMVDNFGSYYYAIPLVSQARTTGRTVSLVLPGQFSYEDGVAASFYLVSFKT